MHRKDTQYIQFEKSFDRANAFHKAYEEMYEKQTIQTLSLRNQQSFINTFVDEAMKGVFGPKGNVLVVASTPGLGNTTLLTSFVQKRKDRKISDEYILSHWSKCSNEAQTLSSTITRWIGILGNEVLGEEITEWNNSNRLDLEHMVSGQPSEQYLMAKFNRFMTLASNGDNKNNVKRRIILVVDGADCILNHAGMPVLHWLPEVLPDGCCVILSTTLHEKINIKPFDIDHSDRAYPREIAMSEDAMIHELINNVRSLSQCEPLSSKGSRLSPILREAMRRKYWLLSVPNLEFEDQCSIVRGTMLRRSNDIRNILESVPRLRGVLLERPEDIEIREAMDELLEVCQGSHVNGGPEDHHNCSSGKGEHILLSDDDDDDLNSDFENEKWWNRKDVKRVKSPKVLRILINIATEAVPGSCLSSVRTCLHALRSLSLNAYDISIYNHVSSVLYKHKLSIYEESFEYVSCLLDGNGLLIRPSTTTTNDYISRGSGVGKDELVISLFRFVIGTIGNSVHGCSRNELLSIVRLCQDVSKVSSSMRSYCLWLLKDELIFVKRKEPEIRPPLPSLSLSKTRLRGRKEMKKKKKKILTSPLKKKNNNSSSSTKIIRPKHDFNRFLSSAGQQQDSQSSIKDDPRSWFSRDTPPSREQEKQQHHHHYIAGRLLSSSGSQQFTSRGSSRGGNRTPGSPGSLGRPSRRSYGNLSSIEDDPKLWFSTTSSPPSTPGYDTISTSWDPRPM